METINLIQVFEGQIYAGTYAVSKILKITHRTIKRLLKKYESFFFADEESIFQVLLNEKPGSPVQQYLLNGAQLKLLFIMMNNKPLLINLKIMCLKDHETDLQFFREIENLSQSWL